jgi:hypothetical protein
MLDPTLKVDVGYQKAEASMHGIKIEFVLLLGIYKY